MIGRGLGASECHWEGIGINWDGLGVLEFHWEPLNLIGKGWDGIGIKLGGTGGVWVSLGWDRLG